MFVNCELSDIHMCPLVNYDMHHSQESGENFEKKETFVGDSNRKCLAIPRYMSIIDSLMDYCGEYKDCRCCQNDSKKSTKVCDRDVNFHQVCFDFYLDKIIRV